MGAERTNMLKPDTFAARLASLRSKAGLSVADLAAAAGLHRDTVYRLERGEREPSLAVAKMLAQALGCTLDDLAG
jgi:transcriptional regulator with XRE-family HTH domain